MLHFISRSFRISNRLSFNQYSVKTSATENLETCKKPPVQRVAKPFDSIPGPKKFPVIGSSWKFFPIIGNYNLFKPLGYTYKMYEEFGSIVRIEAFGINLVFLYGPDGIEQIMRYSGKYPERQSHTLIKDYRESNPKYNTTGLLPSNGPEWWRLRTVAQKIFYNMKIIRSFVDCTDELTKKFVKRTETIYCSKGNMITPDFCDDMTRDNMQLIWFIMFGQDLDCFTPQELSPSSISSTLIHATKYIHEYALLFEYIRPPLDKFLPQYKEFIKCLQNMDKIAIEELDKKVNSRLNNKPKPERDFLMDMFLDVPNIEEADILPLLIDLIMGSVETTATSASFALYHLCKNSRVQEKLYEESISLLPNKEDPITEEILKKAVYVKAFVKESMRLNPISVGIGRKATDDIIISGYHIPKGTVVVTANQIVCLLPEVFKNPQECLPERWIRGGELYENVHPFASIPFGNGTRMCIARRLAEQNLYIKLMRMSRHFKMSWVGEDLGIKSRLLNYPDRPITLRLETRD